MKSHLMFIIVLLSLTVSGCHSHKKNTIPPNILIINVDDLGWADTGFMGSRYYRSPNMDALAAKGLVFTQAYAGAANCAPSRACLMTGLNTPRHRIYTVDNSDRGSSKDRKLIPIENKVILHDSLTTLAEVLNVYGYTTCQAGKWHLSDDSRDHGFDYNIGGSQAGHPGSYYPPYKNIDIDAPSEEYLTDNIMNHVLDFLEKRHGDPFFLYYAPYAVHTPIQKIDSLMDEFTGKTGPEGMNNTEYATMIFNLDRNIGKLIQKLRDLNMYDNTFIIFTSDNGGLYRISKQHPLRAGKGSYYEGGIRVPTFFVWKDHIEPGINQDIPIINLDFFPTILDIIGAQLPGKHFDGISLSDLLLKGKNPDIRPLYFHFPVYIQDGNIETRDLLFRTRPGSVIRYGDWKLHMYFEDSSEELFNLKNDISEKNNVLEKFPGKRLELEQLLHSWQEEVHAPIPFQQNPDYITIN